VKEPSSKKKKTTHENLDTNVIEPIVYQYVTSIASFINPDNVATTKNFELTIFPHFFKKLNSLSAVGKCHSSFYFLSGNFNVVWVRMDALNEKFTFEEILRNF
jgi:hypothetical protein